jgi:hypothetical protein
VFLRAGERKKEGVVPMGRVRFDEQGKAIIEASFGAELLVLSNGSPKARKMIEESDALSPKTRFQLQQSPVIIAETREEVIERLYGLVQEVGQGVFKVLVLEKKYSPEQREELRVALLKYYDAFHDFADGKDLSEEYDGLLRLFYNAGRVIATMVGAILTEDENAEAPSFIKVEEAFFKGSGAMLLYQMSRKKN